MGHKLEKWQPHHNLPTWSYHQIFWRCFISLVKFSYWFKFHVNSFIGSRVLTISYYKGLTRNPEIGNTLVWILPNIWRMGKVRDTKFCRSISNQMLLNTTKYQRYIFYRFWLIKGKPTGGITPPTQFKVNKILMLASLNLPN